MIHLRNHQLQKRGLAQGVIRFFFLVFVGDIQMAEYAAHGFVVVDLAHGSAPFTGHGSAHAEPFVWRNSLPRHSSETSASPKSCWSSLPPDSRWGRTRTHLHWLGDDSARNAAATAHRFPQCRARARRHWRCRSRFQNRRSYVLHGCPPRPSSRSEEHTSELQSRGHLVCRL